MSVITSTLLFVSQLITLVLLLPATSIIIPGNSSISFAQSGEPLVTVDLFVHETTQTIYRPSPGRGQVPPNLIDDYGSELRPDDWSYYKHEVEFDIVPHGENAEIFAAEFVVEYNRELLEFDHVRNGELFTVSGNGPGSALQYTELDPDGETGRVLINIANIDGIGNVALTGNEDALVTISFIFIASGVSKITLNYENFHRSEPNGDFPRLNSETNVAAVEFFRGDFTGTSSIGLTDLGVFSGLYLLNASDPDYRIKADIINTDIPVSVTYFSLPVSSGSVSLLDLSVFSVGFQRSLNNDLPSPASLPDKEYILLSESYSNDSNLGVKLIESYHNSFNPDKIIRFSIPERMHVDLYIYDKKGNEVYRAINEEIDAGDHKVMMAKNKFEVGHYLYVLKTGGEEFTRRMTILR